MCKVASGGIFSAVTAFHVFRLHGGWRFYRAPEKIFNIGMLGILTTLSILSFNAAWEIN